MANVSYISREGDTVDLVCYRHYGNTVNKVEAVLSANPGLAEVGPILPKGTKLVLPDMSAPRKQAVVKTTVKLWD